MAAENQDFVLYRGAASKTHWGPIPDSVNPALPQDIGGWTAIFTMRPEEASNDPPTLSKSASAFGLTTAGIFEVAFSKAETLVLEKRIYVYSLERTNVGFEDVLATGKVNVKLDILNPY